MSSESPRRTSSHHQHEMVKLLPSSENKHPDNSPSTLSLSRESISLIFSIMKNFSNRKGGLELSLTNKLYFIWKTNYWINEKKLEGIIDQFLSTQPKLSLIALVHQLKVTIQTLSILKTMVTWVTYLLQEHLESPKQRILMNKKKELSERTAQIIEAIHYALEENKKNFPPSQKNPFERLYLLLKILNATHVIVSSKDKDDSSQFLFDIHSLRTKAMKELETVYCEINEMKKTPLSLLNPELSQLLNHYEENLRPYVSMIIRLIHLERYFEEPFSSLYQNSWVDLKIIHQLMTSQLIRLDHLVNLSHKIHAPLQKDFITDQITNLRAKIEALQSTPRPFTLYSCSPIYLRLQQELNNAQSDLNKNCNPHLNTSKALPQKHTPQGFGEMAGSAIPQLSQNSLEAASQQFLLFENVSVAWAQGLRSEMEDAHLTTRITLTIGAYKKDVPLYGIFDGHGGDACSDYLQKHLPFYLQTRLNVAFQKEFDHAHTLSSQKIDMIILHILENIFIELGEEYRKYRDGVNCEFLRHFRPGYLEKAYEDIVRKSDHPLSNLEKSDAIALILHQAKHDLGHEYRAYVKQTNLEGKSTANIVLILNDTLWISNVGDTRSILCSNGVAIGLSDDATLVKEKFVQGIFAKGGRIGRDAHGTLRVADKAGSNLAMARAVGHHPFLSAISATAGVVKFSLKDLPPGDKTLIMGCDGLWDVLSSNQAAAIVHKPHESHSPAATLVRCAYNLGSTDNISALVLRLES